MSIEINLDNSYELQLIVDGVDVVCIKGEPASIYLGQNRRPAVETEESSTGCYFQIRKDDYDITFSEVPEDHQIYKIVSAYIRLTQ